MNYKEYKEHIINMTREELIQECLSMKANYDKSCRSWAYTERLRSAAIAALNDLNIMVDQTTKLIDKKHEALRGEYNAEVQTLQDYYDKADEEYRKEMNDAKDNINRID